MICPPQNQPLWWACIQRSRCRYGFLQYAEFSQLDRLVSFSMGTPSLFCFSAESSHMPLICVPSCRTQLPVGNGFTPSRFSCARFSSLILSFICAIVGLCSDSVGELLRILLELSHHNRERVLWEFRRPNPGSLPLGSNRGGQSPDRAAFDLQIYPPLADKGGVVLATRSVPRSSDLGAQHQRKVSDLLFGDRIRLSTVQLAFSKECDCVETLWFPNNPS